MPAPPAEANRSVRDSEGAAPGLTLSGRDRTHRAVWWPAGVVVVLAIVTLFYGLGARGLNEPDEGRYGSIAMEMYRSGDWLIPRLLGRAHMDKPPLTYWAMASAYTVLGPSEFSARLPMALAGLVTLAGTAWMAARLSGPRTAARAALLLLISPIFFAFARIADPNMILTAWTTLAYAAIFGWASTRRPIHRWLFYFALAGAFLTKGPVVFVLVLVPLAVWRFLFRDREPLRGLWDPLGAALALAAGLSWFIVVTRSYPELVWFYLGDEVVGRLLTTQHRRRGPPWFYGPILLGGILPWLPILRDAWREKTGLAFRCNPPLWRLIACAIIVPFVIFSFSGSKLPSYILPIFSSAAVGLAVLSPLPTRPTRHFGQMVWAAMAILAAGVAIGIVARRRGWDWQWTPELLLWAGVALAAWIGLGGFRAAWLREIAYAMVWLAVFQFGAVALAIHGDRIGAASTCAPLGHFLSAHVAPQDRVTCYSKTPRGIGFYFPHPILYRADEFTIQVAEDHERLRSRLYRSDRHLRSLLEDRSVRQWLVVPLMRLDKAAPLVAEADLREVYRDARFVVFSDW